MGLKLTYLPGETILDPDELDGLRIATITRRHELDEFEQLGIEHAIAWSLGKRFTPETIFCEKGLISIHRKMFEEIWSWAGTFRHTNKNIGVDKHQIGIALRELCDDAKYWLAHAIYPPEEIALRFKHRLVSIHPFPNGNGRHSRLVADIIMTHLFHGEAFTWGKTLGENARDAYIQALHAADEGDVTPLITFARE